jgi:hypothetical protein
MARFQHLLPRVTALDPLPDVAPPTAPSLDYLARICVILFEPREVPDEPMPSLVVTESAMIDVETKHAGPAIGYTIEVGLRCHPHEVLEMIDYAVSDGEVHWGRTEWHETEIESLPRRIRRHVHVDDDPPLWYRGRPSYFSAW